MKTTTPIDPNKYCTCQLCNLQHPEQNIIKRFFMGILLQRCNFCNDALTKLNEK